MTLHQNMIFLKFEKSTPIQAENTCQNMVSMQWNEIVDKIVMQNLVDITVESEIFVVYR